MFNYIIQCGADIVNFYVYLSRKIWTKSDNKRLLYFDCVISFCQHMVYGLRIPDEKDTLNSHPQSNFCVILPSKLEFFSVFYFAAFNQRFDQFYYEQNDPNVLVQNFPAYLDPYYSTYRSLGGGNFNFMKVD